MFTGIVEETGVVKKKILNPDGMELTIYANKVLEDLKVNDSISCSGICLTVTKLFDTSFVVQLVEETIDRTTAKFWNVNSRINLERSLLPTTRLGGHFVQGHIDQSAKCTKVEVVDGSWYFGFEYEPLTDNVLVDKGSICVDGTSLTVVEAGNNSFTVAIIPYTYEHTVFHQYKKGTVVNLEFDMLGKYITKLFKQYQKALLK